MRSDGREKTATGAAVSGMPEAAGAVVMVGMGFLGGTASPVVCGGEILGSVLAHGQGD